MQADEETGSELNGPSAEVGVSSAKGRGGGQPLDLNMYATRKTIAQGIMDLGLMCANASQLKCESSCAVAPLTPLPRRAPQRGPTPIRAGHHPADRHLHHIPGECSRQSPPNPVAQVVVGIIFIALGRLNINLAGDRRRADMLNNVSVIIIFLVTVVNVLVTAFGPSELASHNPAHTNKATSWTNYYQGSIDTGLN